MRNRIKMFTILTLVSVFVFITNIFAAPVTKTWDFTNATNKNDAFGTDWEYSFNGSDDKNDLVDLAGNKAYKVGSLTQLIYKEPIEHSYELTYKLQMGRLQAHLNNGLFVRGTMPVERDDAVLNYFDDARTGPGAGDHIAGSGVSFVFKNTSANKPFVRVTFKTYSTEGKAATLKVGQQSFDIMLDETINLAEFHTVKVNDNEAKIEVTFDNAKIFSIDMSNVGVFADDIAEKDVEFFRTASLKDASGTELLKVENTKLAKKSVLCFASRNAQPTTVSYQLDDVSLKINYPDEPNTENPNTENPKTDDGSLLMYIIIATLLTASALSILRKRSSSY